MHKIAGYPTKLVRLDQATLLALKIHPHCAAMPPMGKEERAKALGSMRHGYHDDQPLVLDTTSGSLVDGKNRREIALEVMARDDIPDAIRFTTVPALQVSFPDDEAIHRFVFQAAFARRNMTAEQKAEIVRGQAKAGVSTEIIAKLTGYSERHVERLTADIRDEINEKKQKKAVAGKTSGKSMSQIAKEIGKSKSTAHRLASQNRHHGGNGTPRQKSDLPQRILDLLDTGQGGGRSRARAVLDAFLQAAPTFGQADAYAAWLDRLADRFPKHLSNSDSLLVAHGFPAEHPAKEFDRRWKKTDAAGFFAALQRANAGEPPLEVDIDEQLARERRVHAILDEQSAKALWKTRKPQEWHPELAEKFGYGTDHYDEIGFYAAYSQEMGHVTTRTWSERQQRERFEAVEAAFNTTRSMARVQLPPTENLSEWFDAKETNRQARWLKHADEAIAVLQTLKSQLAKPDDIPAFVRRPFLVQGKQP